MDVMKEQPDLNKEALAWAALVLENQAEELRGFGGKTTTDHVKRLNKTARRLRELELYRWIPVSERLPVDGYIVVGYASPDTIEVSEFHADDGRFWCVGGGWFNATHWMPLPEPPEVK